MKYKDTRRILLCLLVLGVVLIGAGYAARHGYVSLRQARLVKKARTYLDASDPKKALLCLQRALRANPKDVEAARLMADLAERGRSPAALIWRGRVVELASNSTDDRLALARTALGFRDLITASNALEKVNDTGKKTAAYHNESGALAIAVGEFASAQEHFLAASQLEPTNPVPRLNLSVVQLHQSNSPALNEARATLTHLSTNPVVGCQALRELVADAIRQRQTNAALNLAQQLTQNTNSVFKDKLVRLELLRGMQQPQFQTYLAAMQREAATDPGKIYELTTWQVMTTGPASAIAWMQTLPAEVRTNNVVVMIRAQCHTSLQDWRGLLLAIEQQNWAELEFVRHAFLARGMRGLDLASSCKTEWENALKGAGNRKESLVMLLRLTADWNWPAEQEQILWSLVNQFPGEKWATAGLAQLLFSRGRTQGLLTLFGQLSRANPSDLAARNNLALTALLLDAQQFKPHELAREVYDKAPTNASFASTYAYSLYIQEKRAEALKVIELLAPQDLEKPSIAGYYSVLLRAAGDGVKAKKYFDLAAKATLLPEERKLIDQANRM